MAQSARRDPAAQGDLPIRQQGRACRLAGYDRYVCLGRRRAASALLLTEPRGERASAALPRRQAKRRAESAPCLKRDRRPRRAPEGRPRWPEGQHPNPPPKAGKGALRRAHLRHPGFFGSPVKFAVLVRAVAANDRGLLFGRRLHVREYALGALLCERAAAWRALASCDGRRQASFSVSGLARSGRPMPIPVSCFRMDCRCRSTRRFRSRACRLFRFRSAARHLWADRVPALTTAGKRSGGSSGGSVSSGGSGDAYNMMMAQDWGSQAECGRRRDGRQRDGARRDLCDGVELPECRAPRPEAARRARSK